MAASLLRDENGPLSPGAEERLQALLRDDEAEDGSSDALNGGATRPLSASLLDAKLHNIAAGSGRAAAAIRNQEQAILSSAAQGTLEEMEVLAKSIKAWHASHEEDLAARLARNLQMLEEAYAPVIRKHEHEPPPVIPEHEEEGDAVCEAVVQRTPSRIGVLSIGSGVDQGSQGPLAASVGHPQVSGKSPVMAAGTMPALTQAVSHTLAAQEQKLALHAAATKPAVLEAVEQAAAAQAAAAIQAANAHTARVLQELEEELRALGGDDDDGPDQEQCKDLLTWAADMEAALAQLDTVTTGWQVKLRQQQQQQGQAGGE